MPGKRTSSENTLPIILVRPQREQQQRESTRPICKCGLSVVFVSGALSATLALQHLFPYPFLFMFFAAVMASAWFGGTLPGLLSVVTSTLVVDYFFIPPFHSLVVNAANTVNFAAFVVSALITSWVSSTRKETEEALRDARDRLEIRVAERTAELQKLNEGLREREHQLRLLTEVIPQQIWSASPDGFVDYCNQRLLDYVGSTMAETQGPNFVEMIHAQDLPSFGEAWSRALAEGKAFEGQWHFRGADGNYRTFFTRAVPLRDEAGRTIRWYGTNTDIEDRERAEQALAQIRGELARLSRFLTMGELTASIAHEVDQPLTAIVTYGHAALEWLSAKPPNIAEARQAAQSVIQNGTRAGTVLNRIRALYRKEIPSKHWLNLNELIRELIVFVRGEAGRLGISIRMELAPGVPRVLADRVQIEQVLLNLVMNGMEAIRTLKVRPKEIVITSRVDDAARAILLSIEDSGDGVNPEIADRIFDPFFTTKPQGIGMGLSISRSIVEAHGGKLWARSRPMGGAMFEFTIPVNPQETSDATGR